MTSSISVVNSIIFILIIACSLFDLNNSATINSSQDITDNYDNEQSLLNCQKSLEENNKKILTLDSDNVKKIMEIDGLKKEYEKFKQSKEKEVKILADSNEFNKEEVKRLAALNELNQKSLEQHNADKQKILILNTDNVQKKMEINGLKKENENLKQSKEKEVKILTDLNEFNKEEVKRLADLNESHKNLLLQLIHLSEINEKKIEELSDLNKSQEKKLSDLEESKEKELSDLRKSKEKNCEISFDQRIETFQNGVNHTCSTSSQINH